jgi:putative N6-adenine-specific DNA methylase
LYDPCCGSGTIAVEAAQIACNIAPGSMRRFGFEKLVPFQAHVWQGLLNTAREQEHAPSAPVFGSDVAFRMVDFAQRNAERAGVAHAVQLRGGDALQRMPPSEAAGVMLVNPPYGERIEAAGVAGVARLGARELTQTEDGGDFFAQLATHWKKNYPGWTAWMLTPDLKLPGRMRFKVRGRCATKHHDHAGGVRHQHRVRPVAVQRSRHTRVACCFDSQGCAMGGHASHA